MQAKKFVPLLTQAQQSTLEQAYRSSSSSHRTRQRAQAILLSSRGYGLDQLADILSVDRDTVSRWLAAWQERGLQGLSDAPRPGRPSKIDAEVEEALREILEQPSPNLKALITEEMQKRGCK
jgi:transposase